MNLRIQTYGGITAVEALHQGLDNLVNLCEHIEETFTAKISAGGFSKEEP